MTASAGRPVVVTGASGHLGANLLPRLLARGERVRALVRDDERALEGLDVERVRGSLLEPDSLPRAFDGARHVFHLAGMISITGDADGRVRRTNVDGVRNVVDTCLACGIERLVHVSSIHALDPNPVDQPVDESRGPASGAQATAYDRSKAAGEREVRAGVERGLDAVIVRPTGVIGPRDHKPSRTGTLLLSLANRSIPGIVDGGFDWVDARDVAHSIARAAEAGRCGESYLLPGHWHPLADIAALVAEETGTPAPRLISPMALARLGAPFMSAWARLTGGEPLYTAEALKALRGHKDVVGDRAVRELGHAPRPLPETIADSIAWFRDAGILER